MIKPPKLNPGDKVAAISLSWGGPGAIPHRYEAGKRQLEETFGVSVVETKHALRDEEWIWRNPQARADDLMEAFADPTINAIFSTIGGDDSIRTLPYMNLDVIRNNPKIFMGFSDSTITHMVCYKAGLVSFCGPSFMAGFAENGGMFPYGVDSMRKTLFSVEPVGLIEPNPGGWTDERIPWEDPANQQVRRKLNPQMGWNYLQGEGIHQGHLIGGCIEVLDWLRGTGYWPHASQWQDAILFLEPSEDAPTPEDITCYLRTYAALGILEQLSGILYARPCRVDPETFGEYDEAILNVVAEEEGLTELPIITGMDFGHTEPIFVMPYGVQAQIDCDNQTFSITESAVSLR